jgi:hypothetical protein
MTGPITRIVGVVALAAMLVAGCQLFPALGTGPAPVTTPERAAQLVLAQDARFHDLARHDPNLIGQGSWWDVIETAKGYQVTVQIGWGDCEAGCINRHQWLYAVGRNGAVSLLSERGEPLPSPAQGNVSGKVVAGPTCPVERSPPDPQCAPRPVAGATLLIQDPVGHAVATVLSDSGGTFALTLLPGDYVLVAQPVDGLMGTAPPLPFSVVAGSPVELTVEYDTGIR